ncbi:hypothetical protein CHS0354_007808 [Potamilus streckersoni]|uniref:Uncharacterized protein n=1 Tax=Potamilus streckersoni TaxID=2493646 RepID=A0AAE0RR53_9BIVA|nr:hypothetical protein CHS0354_007808 [Potamilus streckersoni]
MNCLAKNVPPIHDMYYLAKTCYAWQSSLQHMYNHANKLHVKLSCKTCTALKRHELPGKNMYCLTKCPAIHVLPSKDLYYLPNCPATHILPCQDMNCLAETYTV